MQVPSLRIMHALQGLVIIGSTATTQMPLFVYRQAPVASCLLALSLWRERAGGGGTHPRYLAKGGPREPELLDAASFRAAVEDI